MDTRELNSDEIDVSKVLKNLWSKRKTIFYLTSIFTFIGLVYAFFAAPYYEAVTTFYTTEDESAVTGQLGAAAAMMGLSGLSGNAGGGYKANDIIRSRKIRTKIINQLWKTDTDPRKKTLLKIWEIDGKNSNEKLERALKALDDCIEVSESKKSSLIGKGEAMLTTVSVITEDRQLSTDIANSLIRLTNEFMQQAKNKNISESIDFIQKRLAENKEELAEAEVNLKNFKKSNQLLFSAELQMEYARLQREVTIKQEVYLTLVKQKEMSQIEAVKRSNVIKVLDEAVRPEKKAKPKRTVIVLIGLFSGVVIGISTVAVKYFVEKIKKIMLASN